MLIPEISNCGVRSGLGDATLPANSFPSITLGTGLPAATSSHIFSMTESSQMIPLILTVINSAPGHSQLSTSLEVKSSTETRCP